MIKRERGKRPKNGGKGRNKPCADPYLMKIPRCPKIDALKKTTRQATWPCPKHCRRDMYVTTEKMKLN
jgi:hypothetical protein